MALSTASKRKKAVAKRYARKADAVVSSRAEGFMPLSSFRFRRPCRLSRRGFGPSPAHTTPADTSSKDTTDQVGDTIPTKSFLRHDTSQRNFGTCSSQTKYGDTKSSLRFFRFRQQERTLSQMVQAKFAQTHEIAGLLAPRLGLYRTGRCTCLHLRPRAESRRLPGRRHLVSGHPGHGTDDGQLPVRAGLDVCPRRLDGG